MSRRFAELFAGAGGLSLGLERAGWECAWHAEIAEQPRAILSHRWPTVPLLGDVTTLDGGALVALHGPIDLLSGGSPCQDLSVAGKRAGLAGERSGLFYEQMRLWKETGADLCLWENVDGARSSNQGRDFGAVLSAFVGAPVPVPRDGWTSAGVVAGPAGVAAWRVLDAQFFGVPQRRRRVFVLGTRTGRVDPAEVLSLAESVRGDSEASGEARKGVTTGPDGVVAFALRGRDDGAQVEVSGSVTSALRGAGGGSSRDMVFDTPPHPEPRSMLDRSVWAMPSALLFRVLSFDWQKGNDVNNSRPSTMNVVEDATNTLGSPAVIVPTILGNGDAHSGFKDADGIVVSSPVSPALRGQSQHSHRADSGAVVCITGECPNFPIQSGIPRRLTPRECERLMDWPDDWTFVPDAKGKPLSDAARYKAIGNGVASVHSQWIGWRLRLALEGA